MRLFMTSWNFTNSQILSSNIATVDAHGMFFISIPTFKIIPFLTGLVFSCMLGCVI